MVSLVVLTKGFRRHGTSVKALSLAQWMGTRYQSKALRLFFAVLSLLLITFIVLIVVGLTKVLAQDPGRLRDGRPDRRGRLRLRLHDVRRRQLHGLHQHGAGRADAGRGRSSCWARGYEHFSDGVHGFLDKLRAIDPALARRHQPRQLSVPRTGSRSSSPRSIVGVAIVCQPHIITKSLLLKTDRDVNRYLTVGRDHRADLLRRRLRRACTRASSFPT